MQIPAIYYEHKINVLVWLNIQDKCSAEHKHILTFVLNIKDLLIFHCMCPKELWFWTWYLGKFAIDHKYSDKSIVFISFTFFYFTSVSLKIK